VRAGESPTLAPPAARQGPGPMPAGAIEAIDPTLNRLVARRMPGGSRASGVGQGTELAQLRAYEPGDDVRHLDPAASARTGTMHVRLQVPERALTTWIVLDLTPSMAFGSAQRLKADVAEGAAMVFGRLGVRRAGSVGVIAFGAGSVGAGHGRAGEAGIRVLAPRGSKPGIVALGGLVSQGVAPDGRHDPGELAAALRVALRITNHPGLVAVISDFREQRGWERPLGALRLRHAVLAVEITDPRESELPDVGRLSVVDPETGALLSVDTRSARLRQRFAAIERERRANVHRELRRLAVEHIRLDTDGDWLRALGRQIR
jgi:uncharacterized protein (DUF58 family)